MRYWNEKNYSFFPQNILFLFYEPYNKTVVINFCVFHWCLSASVNAALLQFSKEEQLASQIFLFLKEIMFLSDIWHKHGTRLHGICCKRALKTTGGRKRNRSQSYTSIFFEISVSLNILFQSCMIFFRKSC